MERAASAARRRPDRAPAREAPDRRRPPASPSRAERVDDWWRPHEAQPAPIIAQAENPSERRSDDAWSTAPWSANSATPPPRCAPRRSRSSRPGG